MPNELIIKLDHLTKTFSKHAVFKDVDFSINKGDFLSITGKSGCGKSTLLNIIGLLDNKFEGNYYILEKNIKQFNSRELNLERNSNFGFVFQSFYLVSHLTVRENILLPISYSKNKKITEEIEKRLGEITEMLEISSLLNEFPTYLSGGEKQRIAFARALILDPEIILCDEPTGNLDEENRDNVVNFLLKLNKLGKTIVLITHDKYVANKATTKYFFENNILRKY